MWLRSFRALSLLSLLAAAPAAHSQYGPPPPPTPYDQCEAAVALAQTRSIPPTLLSAIARVESGRPDPFTGRVRPWPWTINVDGVGSYFDTKQDAIATVRALQARGTKSIDVGCMQVNLFYHPTAFPDLDAAFDPPANAAYAATFLSALHAQSRDWNLAAAYYHSQTQERGEEYQRRVFGRVMTPMGPPLVSASPGAFPGTVFGAFLPASSLFGAIPPASTMFGAFAPASATLPAGPHPARLRPGRSTLTAAAELRLNPPGIGRQAANRAAYLKEAN